MNSDVERGGLWEVEYQWFVLFFRFRLLRVLHTWYVALRWREWCDVENDKITSAPLIELVLKFEYFRHARHDICTKTMMRFANKIAGVAAQPPLDAPRLASARSFPPMELTNQEKKVASEVAVLGRSKSYSRNKEFSAVQPTPESSCPGPSRNPLSIC